MKYILILVAVLAVVLVGWLAFRSPSPAVTPTPIASMTPTQTPTPTPTPTPGLIVHEAAIHTVIIQNFSFSPSSVTVQKGDIIVFQNMDSTQHTVTADTGAFDSGHLDPSAQWTFPTANMTPGTYPYHCSIHTTMHGTIIIQ